MNTHYDIIIGALFSKRQKVRVSFLQRMGVTNPPARVAELRYNQGWDIKTKRDSRGFFYSIGA